MILSPMRFKDYVWPHNPRVYEIRYKKDIVSHRVPFGLYTLQNMGREHRVLRGEGEFSGPGAYAEFKKLATVFYGSEPGVLVHPLWDTTLAYFSALTLQQEPTEDYVKYSFEFRECYEGYEQSIRATGAVVSESVAAQTQKSETKKEAAYHTVKAGDTGWSVAKQAGINVIELMELNRQMRNLNILNIGDILRIR